MKPCIDYLIITTFHNVYRWCKESKIIDFKVYGRVNAYCLGVGIAKNNNKKPITLTLIAYQFVYSYESSKRCDTSPNSRSIDCYLPVPIHGLSTAIYPSMINFPGKSCLHTFPLSFCLFMVSFCKYEIFFIKKPSVIFRQK